MYLKISPSTFGDPIVTRLYSSHKYFKDGDCFLPLFIPEAISIKARSVITVHMKIKVLASSSPIRISPVGFHITLMSNYQLSPIRMSGGIHLVQPGNINEIVIAIDNISDKECEIPEGTPLFQLTSPSVGQIRYIFLPFFPQTGK
jgi:hypothetical protein